MMFWQVWCTFALCSCIKLSGGSSEISFYDKSGFDTKLYTADKAATSCQTLAQWMWRETESVTTEQCVILYSNLFCQGNSFKILAGNYSDLGDFNDKTASYRTCQQDSYYKEYRIRFYEENAFGGYLLDERISPECTTLFPTLRNRTNSIVTHACVILFENEDCEKDDNQYTLPAGVHANFSMWGKLVTSFRACDSQKLRPYRLFAKITQFDVSNGDTTGDQADGKTALEITANKTFFLNANLIVKTERLLNKKPKTVTDQMTIKWSGFVDELESFYLSENISVNFTDDFTSFLRVSRDVDSTPDFPEISLSSIFKQIRTNKVKLNDEDIISVKLPTSSNSESIEFSSEENAFSAIERNVKKRIKHGLLTLYNDPSLFGMTLNFTENQTTQFLNSKVFHIPPCSGYEVSAFVKRTMHFPVHYCLHFELSGEYVDGAKEKLTTTEFVYLIQRMNHIKNIDNFTVLIAGACSTISLDISWYTMFTGKQKDINSVQEYSSQINCYENFIEDQSKRNQMVNQNYTLFVSKLLDKQNNFKTMSTGKIMAIVITVVTAIISISAVMAFYIKKKYEGKGRGLTEEEIEAFMRGTRNVDGNEMGTFVELTALSSPYDRSLEIDRENIEIEEDSLLGFGEFGCVYKAKIFTEDGELEVALKMAKSGCKSSTLQGFLSEIKTLMHLGKHSYIACIMGAYTAELTNGVVYIATEFCHWGSLDKYLKNGENMKRNEGIDTNVGLVDEGLSTWTGEGESDYLLLDTQEEVVKSSITFKEMFKWSYEIACGMEYLSEKNVVHADLATRNVLLTLDKSVKLTDFGLSKRLYDYTKYIRKRQEPMPWRWMSIETLKKGEFSAKSDVWSYGVTLWEIFSLGDKPYPGLSWDPKFVDYLIEGMRLSCPSQASPEIYNIMTSCWRLRPVQRPTFSELTLLLKNFL